MKRNSELDKLRALAVLGTMLAHLDLIYFKPPEFIKLIPYKMDTIGVFGVLLFFIISGYVISASLINKIDTCDNEKTADIIKSFFVKRLFRITPSSVIWILLTLICSWYIGMGHNKGNYEGALFALANIYNIYQNSSIASPNVFGIYWSLSLEEQFYLIFPFFLLFLTSKNNRLSLLFLMSIFSFFIPNPYNAMFPIWGIACGIIIYLIRDKINKIYSTISTIVNFKSLRIISNSFIFTCVLLVSPFIANNYPIFYGLSQSIFLSIIVMIATVNKGLVLPAGKLSPVIEWIGVRSFSIYLSHVPTAYFVKTFIFIHAPKLGIDPLNISLPTMLIIYIPTLIAVCEISYRFIEKPLTEIGRKISWKIETRKVEIQNMHETLLK
ncbi:acyltransferase family protein [Dickeya solani]|uniref:Acyltransferase n=1 Tax=Dickeya solani TaxID=1089444 RepID=A0ABU4EM80_9GAMM|nr:acyltransferase [Dickeya solani]MCA7000821.1 acyltransferase [Dickeya solani]MCZ0823325.1 acyltransferase [Dickeya solani]MDV6997081.1 acyltransferase [Dickeya solani]MDV7006146.1 acyltransferase [Dickeya solani]MDV7040440.1 acyltransferase [Dickeya solani]